MPESEHSPLGASTTERFMNCPGSISLIKMLGRGESDEHDYTKEGTAAHEVAATCLRETRESWEFINTTASNGVEITPAISATADPYIWHCSELMRTADQTVIEHMVKAPDVHPLFKGTMDFGALYFGDQHAKVRDLKGGTGIVVEVPNNSQLKYYAFGLIREFEEIRTVELGIVQPNAFHVDGPIRTWTCTAEDIHTWVHDELVPAMLRTEVDHGLDPGPWCRFCPAKLICPALTSLFKAAATGSIKSIVAMSDVQIGLAYQYIKAAEKYITALEEEVYRRLMRGMKSDQVKLVHKRAHRVMREEAKALAVEKFGDAALIPAQLKSPAQLEELSSEAAAFVKEHAYKPESGLTVALASDNRVAVKVQTTQETFYTALNQLAKQTS